MDNFNYASFEDIIADLKNNLDDADWLSNMAIWLSSMLFNHNTQIAMANLSEKRSIVNYLDQLQMVDGAKKMSVSEAEKRAVVETDNEYEKLKLQGDSITEIIYSIKKRLDVLQWEHRQ